MINRLACAAVLGLLFATGSAAAATNTLSVSNTPSEYNDLALDIVGNQNVLSIAQNAPAASGQGNLMDISIDGDLNGGTGAFSGAALGSGLTPGHLSQDGVGNTMALSVTGSHNLFAMMQSGSANVIDGQISGSGNQAAVVQNGTGNHFSFSQSGIGNIINVSQTSW